MLPAMRYLPLMLLLAGCATTSDISSSPVDRSANSTKPTSMVSACLQRKFSEAPLINEEGQQVFVVKNQFGGTLALLTLIETETGSRVDFRAPNSVFGTQNWQDCL